MLILLRHAEPRRSESDPELTSAGHAMARQAASWALGFVRGPAPFLLHTATRRTQQTADAVAECSHLPLQRRTLEELAEDCIGLCRLHDQTVGKHPDFPQRAYEDVIVVGHHTSFSGMIPDLPPLPRPLDLRRYCIGLALVRSDSEESGWRVEATYAGHLPS